MKKKKTTKKKTVAKSRLAILDRIPIPLLLLMLVATVIFTVLPLQPASVESEHALEASTYTPDTSNIVAIKELGISIKASTELTKQVLRGVVTHNPADDSTSVAFTTDELYSNNRQCDGTNGWIGVMTRYSGPSSAMSEHSHVHGSTNFDFPGFHINYRTLPTSSCALESHENYAPEQLKKETDANRKLWQAMLTAKPHAS
jgi:hypothetical protein